MPTPITHLCFALHCFYITYITLRLISILITQNNMPIIGYFRADCTVWGAYCTDHKPGEASFIIVIYRFTRSLAVAEKARVALYHTENVNIYNFTKSWLTLHIYTLCQLSFLMFYLNLNIYSRSDITNENRCVSRDISRPPRGVYTPRLSEHTPPVQKRKNPRPPLGV